MNPSICASCKEEMVPEPPSPFWMVVNVLFGTAVLMLGAVYSLIIILNVVLLPFWMIFMAGAVAVTTRYAVTWRCPECHAPVALTPEQKHKLRLERRDARRRRTSKKNGRPALAHGHG